MKALSLFPSVMLSTEFSHVVILIALSCYKQHGKITQFNHVFFPQSHTYDASSFHSQSNCSVIDCRILITLVSKTDCGEIILHENELVWKSSQEEAAI